MKMHEYKHVMFNPWITHYWHGYVISNVAIAALVLLKYQAISIHSAD